LVSEGVTVLWMAWPLQCETKCFLLGVQKPQGQIIFDVADDLTKSARLPDKMLSVELGNAERELGRIPSLKVTWNCSVAWWSFSWSLTFVSLRVSLLHPVEHLINILLGTVKKPRAWTQSLTLKMVDWVSLAYSPGANTEWFSDRCRVNDIDKDISTTQIVWPAMPANFKLRPYKA